MLEQLAQRPSIGQLAASCYTQISIQHAGIVLVTSGVGSHSHKAISSVGYCEAEVITINNYSSYHRNLFDV